MANTTKKKILKILLDLAEKTDNPKIALEATRLLIILRSDKSAKVANQIDPEAAELLGFSKD
jgi:hypothetical protein